MDRPLQRVAFVGDYTPRKCGIATFTRDLRGAVAARLRGADCPIVTVNDIPEGYDYPDEVGFEIAEQDADTYRQAADFLQVSRADVLSIQHEFGIYGGPAGSHLLALARRVDIPIVTTLHTVLEHPSEDQARVLEELLRLSARVVVMTERGRRILRERFAVPEGKLDVIPHGIPDMPFVDPNFYKDLFGVEGRRVILTFGLLSPSKGVENVIEALPAVVSEMPDVVYIVVGATHPRLVRSEGETYRARLLRLVERLGLRHYVRFHDRYVTDDELKEFLGAADVYVTPHQNVAQITSGTLSYAFGCGKAVISTPYWHAEELLAEGRGVLVPFRSPEAIGQALLGVLGDDTARHAMRKRAYLLGREMVWSAVAQRYLETFAAARTYTIASGARSAPRMLANTQVTLPDVRLHHLKTLTDGTGICQHAAYRVPAYEQGYCTDDNARALLLMVLLEEAGIHDPEIHRLALRYAAFVRYAYNRENGRFRNFLSFDRRWAEPAGSDDSHGRALWALGATAGRSSDRDLAMWAARMFNQAVPAALDMTSPRAWAFTLLGACEYARRLSGDRSARQVRETMQTRLLELYRANASDGWRWFESIASYANARLCHALIVSGGQTGDPEALRVGIDSLSWLCAVQTADTGHFRPIGTLGFCARGGARALFDQQPLEASCSVSACLAAFLATQDTVWLASARRAFEWFLGHNDLGSPLYEPGSGGCRDGIHPDRLNQNMGAESTLAFLLALLEMRVVEHSMLAYERGVQAAPSGLETAGEDTDP